MMNTGHFVRRATARDLHFFQNPEPWTCRPFLPLSRQPIGSNVRELGVLYDARGTSGTFGYACTVFLANLFFLPPTETQILALPKHVYDTFEELANDGWCVD